jgi:hypothetical protein
LTGQRGNQLFVQSLDTIKVAEDLGVKKWWKPTPEMEKYVKTYLT